MSPLFKNSPNFVSETMGNLAYEELGSSIFLLPLHPHFMQNNFGKYEHWDEPGFW